VFGSRKLARHAQLVNRMAATVGADLPDALADGRITGEAMRTTVLRCTACDDPEACAHWLEAHTDGAEAAPSYCRNAAFLAALGKAG
jgi:hypothetical protein